MSEDRAKVPGRLSFSLSFFSSHSAGTGEPDTRPALAHADITTSQYVYVKKQGIFKLNDFNRCRFIRWNEKKQDVCPFHVGNNPGTVSIVSCAGVQL